jgi:hypothetical protein
MPCNRACRRLKPTKYDRVCETTRARRLNLEPLESRLLLDAGSPSHFPPAVRLSGPPAAELAPAVEQHQNGRAFAALAQKAGRERLVVTQPPGTPQLFGFILNEVPFRLAIAVEDGHGRVLTGFNGRMTVSVAANPTGAKLGGTLTVTAKHGVAVFSNLTLSQPGNGYVLRVAGDGLAVDTAPFDVGLNEIVYAV